MQQPSALTRSHAVPGKYWSARTMGRSAREASQTQTQEPFALQAEKRKGEGDMPHFVRGLVYTPVGSSAIIRLCLQKTAIFCKQTSLSQLMCKQMKAPLRSTPVLTSQRPQGPWPLHQSVTQNHTFATGNTGNCENCAISL